ncbi:MAG: hypothetical protein KUG51_04795, partial [Urechidicola sp.]|nr:hypothetical protein [Urechidicola sp.]
DAESYQITDIKNIKKKAPVTQSDSENNIITEESVILLFEKSNDAGLVLEAIKDLFDIGKDDIAKSLLKELETRCGFKDQFAPMEVTQDWVFEKVKSYCDNYDSSLFTKLVNEGSKFNSVNPEILSLIKSDETDINLLSEDFFGLLIAMKHNSSYFMSDASEVIRFFGTDLLVPLELGQSNSVNYNLLNIQTSAVKLYGCQRFGGCGPESQQVLSYCFSNPVCEQGWSLIDYYQNTLSPVDFKEVVNILDTIRRYERDGSL